MSEDKRITGTPEPREAITGGASHGEFSEKSRNSAEVNSNLPGPGYQPPAMSADALLNDEGVTGS